MIPVAVQAIHARGANTNTITAHRTMVPMASTLERRVMKSVEAEIGDQIQPKRVLITSAADRFGMALSFDEAGYEANPGYNSGDDAKNAILMLKQEVSNDELDRIENVLIEKNFFQGGVYCINHSFSESRPNLFETTQIRDNYFVRRGNGRYVIRHTDFADCYSNNRIIDLTDDRGFVVGEPIGYQNG